MTTGSDFSLSGQRQTGPSPSPSPSPPATFKPEVGQMCEGERYNGSGEIVRGKYYGIDGDGDVLLDEGVMLMACKPASLRPAPASPPNPAPVGEGDRLFDGENVCVFCECSKKWWGEMTREYDRRKSLIPPAPSQPAEQAKGEMYGTMPSELPETLPAGTRWKLTERRYGEALTPVRLSGESLYVGKFSDSAPPQNKGMGACDTSVNACYIDWSTVPKHPPPSAVSEPRCVDCNVDLDCAGSLTNGRCTACYKKRLAAHAKPSAPPAKSAPASPVKTDPYAEHRRTVQPDGDRYITDNRNGERRKERIAALETGDPLSLILIPRKLDGLNGTELDDALAANAALHRRVGADAELCKLAAHRSRLTARHPEAPGGTKGVASLPARGVRNEFANQRVLDGHPDNWPSCEGEE